MKQELIWELMKQAGELAYEEHKAKCLEEGLDPERTVWSVTGATYEKFAELIVQKCADIGEQYADGNYEVYNNIVEYFGMQEPEE
jgi:hypothetical protein